MDNTWEEKEIRERHGRPRTHMFAGPCPVCGMMTISIDDKTGNAWCESIRVFPVLPDRTLFGVGNSWPPPLPPPLPKTTRKPCPWTGQLSAGIFIEDEK